MTVTSVPGTNTVSEAAIKAKTSVWTIRNEIKEGRMVASRYGRILRVQDKDLAAWMDSRRVNA